MDPNQLSPNTPSPTPSAQPPLPVIPTAAVTQSTPTANPAPPAPTQPPISPPPPPPSGTIPPANSFSETLKNRNAQIGGLIVFAIIILGILGYAFFGRTQPRIVGNAPSIAQKVLPTVDLTKYDKDTDQDGYPDFVETELGLNPTVSEYTRCKQDTCEDANLSNAKAQQRNILILLDSSGSMALKDGSQTRMDSAKQAIKSYVNKSSSANANIGILIYGHKGSNSTSDKAISCASAEVLAPLGTVNAQTIDGILAQVKPVGWTPTGLAIRSATQVFNGKEGQKNELIVLSDGEETCDSNPVEAAKSVNSSGVQATVNIIGFAVDAKTQTELREVSAAGGGIFSYASNSDELGRKFNELYENSKKLLAESRCKEAELDVFRTCYNEANRKVQDWASSRRLLLYKKEINQDEYDKLDALYNAAYDQRKRITDEETEKFIQNNRQNWNQLNQ